MNWEEAYRIIGIAPTASEQEIRQQYLYKVQILHPDWNFNKPVAIRKKAEEELKEVNEAYNVLKDSINNPFRTSPKLDISLRKIRFKEVDLGQKKSASFEVKSVGGAYSKIWIDDSPAPWLRVTDIRSLTSELLPLEVTIETTGIGEPKKHYACSLMVRLENEQTKAKDEAIVKVELWMKAEPGILKVEPKKIIIFRFVEPGTLKMKSFELSNIGRSLLQGHLSTTKPWLSVSPDSVTIAPSTKTSYTATLATNVLRRGFADKAFINIITNGGNGRIPVELSMAPLPLRKLRRALLLFISVCLLAPTPIIVASIFRPPNYWGEPFFWVAMGIYLALIGEFFYWLYSRKSRKRRKTSA
ncbi:J domain-containing protein [Chloroflexota bacterium]